MEEQRNDHQKGICVFDFSDFLLFGKNIRHGSLRDRKRRPEEIGVSKIKVSNNKLPKHYQYLHASKLNFYQFRSNFLSVTSGIMIYCFVLLEIKQKDGERTKERTLLAIVNSWKILCAILTILGNQQLFCFVEFPVFTSNSKIITILCGLSKQKTKEGRVFTSSF